MHGLLVCIGDKVYGRGTKFTSAIAVGDDILVHQRPEFRGRVTSIQSDEVLTVSAAIEPPLPEGQKYKVASLWCPFIICSLFHGGSCHCLILYLHTDLQEA